MLSLALRSLWTRGFVTALTVAAIALSVALILGVERLRSEARVSFANSASGIDMIVAARGNPVQILLATVFGVGSTGAGLSGETYKMVAERHGVAWAVPVQMGDNHRGFPVVGTTTDYFTRIRHSGGQALAFAEGGSFASDDTTGAVVGAEVAARFGYGPGDVIVNAHGAGAVSFDMHDDTPFSIAGVLARTGTAVDRMVLVSLAGFDSLHATRQPMRLDPLTGADSETSAEAFGSASPDTQHNLEYLVEQDQSDEHAHEAGLAGAKSNTDEDHDEGRAHEHSPELVNAIYVGLENRMAILDLQRDLSDYRGEAISAVLPSVALLELWSITGTAEAALQLMSWAVALAGMTGMVVMLSASLEARRREFAILRAVGATPGRIFALIVIEAALLTVAGLLSGAALLALATSISDPILSAKFGIRMGFEFATARDTVSIVAILAAGVLSSFIPALRVYRMTLSDGLTLRI